MVVYFSFCPVFEERLDIKTTVIRVDDPRTTVETRPNPNTNPNHTRIIYLSLSIYLSHAPVEITLAGNCPVVVVPQPAKCKVPGDISSRRNLPEAASQSNPHHQGMPRGHAPSSRATTPADDHATSPLHAHAHSTRMSHESVWPRRS
eukprot:scaffold35229_cov63-Phaeocystis_antarctica.AAC.1